MPLPSKESLEFLQEMLSTPSPSGFEGKIQNVIRKHYEKFADDVHRDVHGNQWFAINPKGAIRIMLCGHVDEIGLMVKYIDDQGFIWVTKIGGPDPLQHWGQRVHVHTKNGPPFPLSEQGAHRHPKNIVFFPEDDFRLDAETVPQHRRDLVADLPAQGIERLLVLEQPVEHVQQLVEQAPVLALLGDRAQQSGRQGRDLDAPQP